MHPADAGTAPTCLFCGEPERLELFEIWTDHSFMLESGACGHPRAESDVRSFVTCRWA